MDYKRFVYGIFELFRLIDNFFTGSRDLSHYGTIPFFTHTLDCFMSWNRTVAITSRPTFTIPGLASYHLSSLEPLHSLTQRYHNVHAFILFFILRP